MVRSQVSCDAKVMNTFKEGFNPSVSYDKLGVPHKQDYSSHFPYSEDTYVCGTSLHINKLLNLCPKPRT
jgi:hypothetical protein